MTIREQAREICKQPLGMHQYTSEERRIIHEYRRLSTQAHNLIDDWRAGKITRDDITAAIDSADDPESLRELLNIHRDAAKKAREL